MFYPCRGLVPCGCLVSNLQAILQVDVATLRLADTATAEIVGGLGWVEGSVGLFGYRGIIDGGEVTRVLDDEVGAVSQCCHDVVLGVDDILGQGKGVGVGGVNHLVVGIVELETYSTLAAG